MRAAMPRTLARVLPAVLALASAPSAGAQPEPEKIVLTTADSVRIASFWYANSGAEKAPVAVLLHNPGATHLAWKTILPPLYRAGFQILSIDFRGHGESKDFTPEIYERMRRHESQPYLDMIHDVEAAVRWLSDTRKIPAQRIALVGGEFGADLAIQAAARNRSLGAAVALSPSKHYFQFPLVDQARNYGNRPLYIIIPKQLLSEGSAEIAEIMRRNPNFEMKVLPRLELHGVDMLNLSWDIEGLVTRWLGKVFDLKSP